MKNVILLLPILLLISCNVDPIQFLDKNFPGEEPKIFAKDFISTETGIEFSCTMSPDKKEVYFTRRTATTPNQIFVTKYKDGKWSLPEVTSFSKDHWANEPAISPDGKRIYFGSKRKLTDTTEVTEDARIWFAERTNGGWTEPEYFGEGLMYVTVTNKGDIYYTDKTGGSINTCFLARKRYVDGKFQKQEVINIPTENIHGMAHPFISPDEEFLIYDYEDDLYIVFNTEEGWSGPLKFGDNINTRHIESCAYVSPDGKYLFFSRFVEEKESGKRQSNIFWVDAKVIQKLKNEVIE